jgi:hypothetical protein
VLAPEKIMALDEIGFHWVSSGGTWYKHYNELRKYQQQHGNCNVPTNYPLDEALSKWVSTQRMEWKKMKTGQSSMKMNEERETLLNQLDFDWQLTSSIREKTWEDNFSALKQFKAQNGHCLVPQLYPSNLSLGWWVSHQRVEYKLYTMGRKSNMTAEHKDTLEKIGFTWTMRHPKVKKGEPQIIHDEGLSDIGLTKYKIDNVEQWIDLMDEMIDLMANACLA